MLFAPRFAGSIILPELANIAERHRRAGGMLGVHSIGMHLFNIAHFSGRARPA
jgi:phage tail tube protein FII